VSGVASIFARDIDIRKLTLLLVFVVPLIKYVCHGLALVEGAELPKDIQQANGNVYHVVDPNNFFDTLLWNRADDHRVSPLRRAFAKPVIYLNNLSLSCFILHH